MLKMIARSGVAIIAPLLADILDIHLFTHDNSNPMQIWSSQCSSQYKSFEPSSASLMLTDSQLKDLV